MAVNFIVDMYLLYGVKKWKITHFVPDCLSAFSACGTAKCGAGKSKKTASTFPFNSSVKP